jgi:protease I
MGKLNGKKVAIIAMDGFEESELLSPKQALEDAGAEVEVLSPVEGSIRAWAQGEWGNSLDVDRDVSQAEAEEYDALMLPGGVINADHLRANEDSVRLVSEFFDLDKPVAAICHAAWALIEADRVHGRRMTSYHTLKTDLLNAGADWVDEPAVEDENLLTSRAPADLPAFNEKMIELFATWAEPKTMQLPTQPRGIRAEPVTDEEAGLEELSETPLTRSEPEGQPLPGLERYGRGGPQELGAEGEGEPVAGLETRREDESAQAAWREEEPPREAAAPSKPRRAKKKKAAAPAGRGTSREHRARRTSGRRRPGRRGSR